MDSFDIADLRTDAISRIMLEFEGCPNASDNFRRVEIRKILKFDWGIPSDEVIYYGISNDMVNIPSCQALLGPHGFAVWRAMKARYEQR